MIWKRRKLKNEKFENFDEYLFGEIFEFLCLVQPLINATNSKAETLAAVDAMINGLQHAAAGERGESCPCCKYWCSGTQCPVVQDSWFLFIENLPELKVLMKHA